MASFLKNVTVRFCRMTFDLPAQIRHVSAHLTHTSMLIVLLSRVDRLCLRAPPGNTVFTRGVLHVLVSPLQDKHDVI